MPTPAERQKQYRERLKYQNPEKYIAAKKKNAERTNRNRKRIKDCQSEAEKEEMRKKWREDKKNQQEKKSIEEVECDSKKLQKQINKLNYGIKKENVELKTKIASMTKVIKKLRKKINRIQRKNNELVEFTKQLKAQYDETYNAQHTVCQENNEMTPCTKADSFIDQNLPTISISEKKKVKKRLMEHNVLVDSLKECYESTQNNDSKRIIKSIVDGSTVEKYKMKGKMATYLGLKGKIRRIQVKLNNYTLLNKLKEFFERDDVSRATAGKKEFKTFKKDKRQRRYLLDTLDNLFKKYKSEGGRGKLTTFKKYRPFYILPPKVDSRETCACIKHENILMKAKVLKSLGLIKSQSLDEILASFLCNPKSKECSYGECAICEKMSLEFNLTERSLEDTVNWKEWSLQTHEYKDKANNNERKITKRMIKTEKTGLLKDLVAAFSQELTKFKKHSYNIIHQYKEHQRCIKTLDDYTVLIHVDFSENYATKLNTEIQAMHFGASRNQITLHTGLIYSNKRDPLPFCSISANNCHGPEAIWEHLKPVLNHIKNEFPTVDTVHFFSDGPTSQYRQKKNFYFFADYTKKYGFRATWNFFEASHGKGAADGIGGTLKRKMDSLVAYGSDITDAETAYELLKKSGIKIKLFYVPEDTIQMQSLELTPVPGTMTLHQIITTNSENTILYRSLSCFCPESESKPGFCNCLDPQRATLMKQVTQTKRDTTKSGTKTITVLADIRNTMENTAHFDLRKFGPLSLKHIKPDVKLLNANKTRNEPIVVEEKIVHEDIYTNPMASCSKTSHKQIQGIIRKRKRPNTHKNAKKSRINYDSSTDTDTDTQYSLHNTSEDECYTSDNIIEEIVDNNGTDYDVNITQEQKNKNDMDLNNTRRELKVLDIHTEKNKTDRYKKEEEERSNIDSDLNIEHDQITNKRKTDTYKKEKEERNNIDSDLTIEHDQITNERKTVRYKKEEEESSYIDSDLNKEHDQITNKRKTDTYKKEKEEKSNIDSDLNIEHDQIPNEREHETDRNVEDMIEDININSEWITPSDKETEMNLHINDSILVRYYERKSWKYYIGFIENINITEQKIYYTVLFLKTIKKPQLRFVVTKKIDRDIITAQSIVKKLELTQNTEKFKEYFIMDADYVYFDV